MIHPRESATVLHADLVIVGAGLAGIATAESLARRAGGRKIILLEKEKTPGFHSSGRNAAMVRQVTSEEAVSVLARRGAAHIRDLAAADSGISGPALFRPTGSVLLAGGAKRAQLERDLECARAAGVESEPWTPEVARGRYPVLRDAAFEIACHTRTDGVVDLAKLVRRYLEASRASGVQVLFDSRVERFLTRNGRLEGVSCGSVEVRAPIVVDAGGPWASELAELAGASPMPLRPRRRHIFVTRPLEQVDPSWPFLWDTSTEVYFRPEEGGLLLSPCDEAESGDKDSDASDPRAHEALEEKLARQFPSLVGLPIERSWSAIRTLTPDGRFIVGPDPRLQGFFWVAGLGGHGVTSSHAVGELAADLILEPERDRENPHSPSRFADRGS